MVIPVLQYDNKYFEYVASNGYFLLKLNYFCPMQLIHRYTGHVGSVYALAQAGNGSFFSGGGDRIVARWSLEAPADGDLIARATDAVYSLCHLPQADRLLIGQGKGGVHVIHLAENSEERLLQLHDGAVFDIAYHSPSNRLFTLGGEGGVCALSADDFQVEQRIRLTEKKVRVICFHPESPVALVGIGDGSIALIDILSLKVLHRFQAHQEDFSVNAITFSPDGKYFMSGSRDAHLHLYETETLKLVSSIPAHNYAVYAIAFDPSGRFFATASRDKTVKIWDYEKMEVLERLEGNDGKGHINSVNKLIWLEDGTLLSAGDDRAIQSWK